MVVASAEFMIVSIPVSNEKLYKLLLVCSKLNLKVVSFNTYSFVLILSFQ
jgi:hypothetical protein